MAYKNEIPEISYKNEIPEIPIADRACSYLRDVLQTIAPQCEPSDDLLGLCTQIDNMIAGYRQDLTAADAAHVADQEEIARLKVSDPAAAKAVMRLDQASVAAILCAWAWRHGGKTIAGGQRPKLNWNIAKPLGHDGDWEISFVYQPGAEDHAGED